VGTCVHQHLTRHFKEGKTDREIERERERIKEFAKQVLESCH